MSVENFKSRSIDDEVKTNNLVAFVFDRPVYVQPKSWTPRRNFAWQWPIASLSVSILKGLREANEDRLCVGLTRLTS